MFWDTFLRRVYGTFGDLLGTSLHGGLGVATQAYLLGFLEPALLNDRSIVILVLLCPPTTAAAALRHLAAALAAHSTLPHNTADFTEYLYRRVLAGLPSDPPPPTALPNPPPPWLAARPPEEVRFLEAAVTHLGLEDRVRLYLS